MVMALQTRGEVAGPRWETAAWRRGRCRRRWGGGQTLRREDGRLTEAWTWVAGADWPRSSLARGLWRCCRAHGGGGYSR